MPRRGRKDGKYSYSHKNADHTGGGLGVAKLEKELRHAWKSVQGRLNAANDMHESETSEGQEQENG